MVVKLTSPKKEETKNIFESSSKYLIPTQSQTQLFFRLRFIWNFKPSWECIGDDNLPRGHSFTTLLRFWLFFDHLPPYIGSFQLHSRHLVQILVHFATRTNGTSNDQFGCHFVFRYKSRIYLSYSPCQNILEFWWND